MKRSEMIKIITNALMSVHLPSYYHNNDQKQLASELLRDIEEAGMLPPIHPKWVDEDTYALQKAHGTEIYVGVGDPDCGRVAKFSHIWETENE